MSGLRDRLIQNSAIKTTAILEDSILFSQPTMVTTSVPAFNVAFSGSLTGGVASGLTQFAGPSKHFKTAFCLLAAAAYMKQFPDAIMLLHDSEFGMPLAYFDAFGIDKARVIHTPVTNIEELKFDAMKQLAGIKRGDRVVWVIDSIGNLASKKEVEDALAEKSAADMTRAKQLKSFFRMVTPHLTLKDIPMLVVNHTYKTQEMYAKDVVSGGTGAYYSSDRIFIVGRQQEKEGDEVTGFNFILKVEKSRHVKEKTKVPIEVRFDGGISRWSGLLDMALESGHVIKPKVGWYARAGETKNWRKKDTDSAEFWLPILKDPTFDAWVTNTYKLAMTQMVDTGTELSDDEIASEFEDA